jgi:hypothetical protein
MTAQVTPPRRESHWLRNASIGVIVVMVVLAVVGSAVDRQQGDQAPAGPAGPAATDGGAGATPAAFPDISPSPPPSGTTLLAIKGTAPLVSEDFTASGDTVDVKYDYTCGPNDSFSADFYGAQQSPLLPDNLVSDDLGQSDSSITTESLNGMPGPFHVEVDSSCTWSLSVIGQP